MCISLNRSRAGFVVVALSLLTSCGGTDEKAPVTVVEEPQRPNIVVVVADSLRADRLSLYGYPEELAPWLSQLGAESVVFDRAFATAGWTTPSVASLFTSVYPTQEGLLFGKAAPLRPGQKTQQVTRIPDDVETIADALGTAGYSTWAISDNLLTTKSRNFNKGFDYFERFRYVNAENINAHLETLREQIVSKQPYFLYVHYMDTHLPYHRRQLGLDDPPPVPADAPKEDKLAAYDSELRFLDAHLDRLFESFGMGENTLFVFTSDHGDEFFDHGGYGHMHTLYQELLHVPLVIRYPKEFPARRVRDNVSLVDLLPTLRDYLSLEPSDQDRGISLVPSMRGRSDARLDRDIFAHTAGRRFDEMHAVVRKRWKLIRVAGSGSTLFDLQTDPGELEDVSQFQAELKAELLGSLSEFESTAKERTVESAVQPMNEEELEKLRALGYAQ